MNYGLTIPHQYTGVLGHTVTARSVDMPMPYMPQYGGGQQAATYSACLANTYAASMGGLVGTGGMLNAGSMASGMMSANGGAAGYNSAAVRRDSASYPAAGLPHLQSANSFTPALGPQGIATGVLRSHTMHVSSNAACSRPGTAPAPMCGMANGPGVANMQHASPAGRSAAHATVRSILEDAGLGHLVHVFEAEEVTSALLPFLDAATLEALGVTSSLDHARLREAISNMGGRP